MASKVNSEEIAKFLAQPLSFSLTIEAVQWRDISIHLSGNGIEYKETDSYVPQGY